MLIEVIGDLAPALPLPGIEHGTPCACSASGGSQEEIKGIKKFGLRVGLGFVVTEP